MRFFFLFFFLSLWRIYVRARVCTRNYISILHFSLCVTRDECALKRPDVHRWIISTDRTRARVTWLLHVAMTHRRGAARRESAQSESKFPLPPTPLLPPPPSSRRPSRTHHHGPLTRVIDARSVNRLLPFINSPGRHAAGGRIVLPQKPRGGGGDGGNHETAYGRTGRRTDTSAVTLRDRGSVLPA